MQLEVMWEVCEGSCLCCVKYMLCRCCEVWRIRCVMLVNVLGRYNEKGRSSPNTGTLSSEGVETSSFIIE